MSVPKRIDINLTAEQLTILQPLFDHCHEQANLGKTGILVAQPHSLSEEYPGIMRVAFVEQARAEIIASILKLRLGKES